MPNVRPFAFLLPLALASGCGSTSPVTPPAPICGNPAPVVSAAGVTLHDACGNGAALLPRVLVGGAWHGAGLDGACTTTGASVICPAGAAGSVSAAVAGQVVTTTFTAAVAATVQAIGLDGTATLAGATSWLSNGFQSWSQSGVVALAPAVSDSALAAAVAAVGDTEVLRAGNELSWFFTFAGGPAADGTAGTSLFAGALSASQWKPWAQIVQGPTALGVRLTSGGAGEVVAVAAGASVTGEPWRLELGDGLEGMERRWAAGLATRRTTTPRPAQPGWNSWYQLWDGVAETDVRANAALLPPVIDARVPAGAPPLRVVIDDGWEQAWGDWTPNARFPSGLDGIAADFAKQGLTTGVWLAPLLAEPASAVATAHPDWFVPGISYHHPVHGDLLVLDVTNPAAAAHLTAVIQQIVGWGMGLLKIDFLFAGTYEGKRAAAVTGMQAYGQALDLIRKAAGQATLLVAVGAPVLETPRWVDGWRVGADIAYQSSGPAWPFLPNQARSVASRWPVCLVTLCDANPVLLRVLTQDEVQTGGAIVGFAGGALFLSDNLRTLAAPRQGWGFDAAGAALALGGVPSVPEDPYPPAPPATLDNVVINLILMRSTQVVPTRWKTPSGARFGVDTGDDPLPRSAAP